MALQSLLFRGDPKLEAAAMSDAAHVLPGDRGEHVRKLQLGLIHLDAAAIAPDGVYGPATAAAVLAYKRRRNIINRTYQAAPDNIVGRMTMASLDAEMVRTERVVADRRAPRIVAAIPSRRSSVRRSDPLHVLAVSGTSRGVLHALASRSPTILVPSPALAATTMEIRKREYGGFLVIDGIGGTVRCWDESVGMVFDRIGSSSHGGTMRATTSPQAFVVLGRGVGTTFIEARVPSQVFRFGIGSLVRLNVARNLLRREVVIAFHFLAGPRGVASTRAQGSIDAALSTMNELFESQTGISFRKGPVAGALAVPQLSNKTKLTLRRGARTVDWNAVVRNRASAPINVFFVGAIDVEDMMFANAAVALTDTPGKPQFQRRDCIMQDDLKGIDLGLALAHEATHALGEDDTDVAGDLRNPASPGRTIPADAAERMSQNLDRF